MQILYVHNLNFNFRLIADSSKNSGLHYAVSEKNPSRMVGVGFRRWNFQQVLKKEHVEIPGIK